MAAELPTLHHVTATVANAREDLEFYTRVLGLRLVKKTVNFDNPRVYHFYYGDEVGTPSTIMTTFPYSGWGVREGRKGAGQITATSFSVPPGGLAFWRERLPREGRAVKDLPLRFGEAGLALEDPSGLVIELLEAAGDHRSPWLGGGVPEEAALQGVHAVTLRVRRSAPTEEFLRSVLGFREVGRQGATTRMATGRGGPGAQVDVVEDTDSPEAVNGLGTVHHVAFAVADEAAQLRVREELAARGVHVTEVRDRQYFRSIYFREPGGILYEIATAGPGFTLDEEPARLGEALKLPPWEEQRREEIEAGLPSLLRGGE